MAAPSYRLPLLIAVTGHRDLVDAEIPVIREATRRQLQQLAERFPDRDVQLMTGLAEGADQLAADVAGELGIAVLAVLPMPLPIYQADFATNEARARFEQCLSRTTEIVELPLAEGRNENDITEHGQARDEQYAHLGVYLAAHCHLLLAYWDGKPAEHIGGTGSVVEFHHDEIMRGLTGDTYATQQMLIDDESDLVLHIVCSRDRPDGTPANACEPGDAWWFTKDSQQQRTRDLPTQHQEIFDREAGFSRDARRALNAIRRHPYPLTAAAPPTAKATGISVFDHWFKAADYLALHFQKRMLMTLRLTHCLAFLMGLSFILYSDVRADRAFMFAFLGFFVVASLIQWVANRSQWSRKYHEYRALAEGLRVQFYWAIAGVRDESPVRFSHDNFVRTQEPELGWIRNAMRVAGRVNDATHDDDQQGLQFAIKNWVGDKVSGQQAYFEKRVATRLTQQRLTEILGHTSLLISVLMVLLTAIAGSQLPEHWIGPLLAVMGGFLLVYAIRQGYGYAVGEKDLIKQYRFMLQLFRNASKQLTGAATDDERRQVLRALGRAALAEHSEWLAMQRSRAVDQSEIWRMGS